MSHGIFMNFLRKICEDVLQHVTTILAQYDPNTLAVLCSYAVLRQTMKLLGTSNPERHASLVHLGVTFIGVIGRCTGQVWKLQLVDVKTVKTIVLGGINTH